MIHMLLIDIQKSACKRKRIFVLSQAKIDGVNALAAVIFYSVMLGKAEALKYLDVDEVR